MICYFFFQRLVPESIRWLLTQKKYAEARELILLSAKMNEQQVPEHLLIIPDERNNDMVLFFRYKTEKNGLRFSFVCRKLAFQV